MSLCNVGHTSTDSPLSVPGVWGWAMSRVGVNSGIECELSSIPNSIPGIGLGIGIEEKGIGIELELRKNARN